MPNLKLADDLKQVLVSQVEAEGFDLIEVNIYPQGRNTQLIRLLVDKPQGGITLNECQKLNKEIDASLERGDIIVEGHIVVEGKERKKDE